MGMTLINPIQARHVPAFQSIRYQSYASALWATALQLFCLIFALHNLNLESWPRLLDGNNKMRRCRWTASQLHLSFVAFSLTLRGFDQVFGEFSQVFDDMYGTDQTAS
jgi:hypothetical protein